MAIQKKSLIANAAPTKKSAPTAKAVPAAPTVEEKLETVRFFATNLFETVLFFGLHSRGGWKVT